MPIISYRNSTDDGWIQVSGYLTEHMMVFFVNGNLQVGVHPIIITNMFGYDMTITKLLGFVDTPSSGSSIAIDVLVNGNSALDDYYYINDGDFGELSSNPNGFFTFTIGDSLQIEIIQVGSVEPGANLTFQIGGVVSS